MTVRTYYRETKDGRKVVYVDYSIDGNRKRERTVMFYHSQPKNSSEREHNKETKKLEENFVSNLTLKIQSGELGIQVSKHKNKNFIEFFSYLTQKRESTDKNYSTWRSALKHLKEFCPDGLSFKQMDKHWLEDFKHFLSVTQGLKSSSANNYFNVVKHGIHDAFRERLIPIDFATLVSAPTVEHAIRVFLTQEEIQKLKETECKNLILKKAFLFSCMTGMAYADIKKLEWKDFRNDDEGNFFIDFHRKKTKGLQNHPISKEAREFLGVASKLPNEKVFRELNYNSWMNMQLREWVYSAGIQKTITFHCARHSYATLLLHKKADITVVKELLGHNDLKTTMIYAKVMDIDKRNAADLIHFGI